MVPTPSAPYRGSAALLHAHAPEDIIHPATMRRQVVLLGNKHPHNYNTIHVVKIDIIIVLIGIVLRYFFKQDLSHGHFKAVK